MQPPPPATTHADGNRFLLVHVCLIPLCLALTAFLVHGSGLDQRISSAFFDPAARSFPARGWSVLEVLGHRVAKSAVVGLWLVIVSAATAATLLPRLREHRPIFWTTALAMALGPAIVVALKDLNAYRCPWDLVQFGGLSQYGSGWFVPRANAGHCFPSGHAAGGFSLVALFFAGCALDRPRLQRAGLVATLTAGCAFSFVRVAQGAHFLSHNLWSAAIDWCAAALVFSPILLAAGTGTAASRPTPARGSGVDTHSKSAVVGLRWVRLATKHSLQGLRAVWSRDAAFRQELIASTLLTPVALLARVTPYERCALFLSLAFVLVVELLNSAVETAVDLASPDHHRLAGIAKDAGSAAVLLSLGIAAAVWFTILAA